MSGRIPPISALYQVRASRPSLRRLVRANCARSSAALWNFVPTLGLWGSSGSEMPSHFRKCARLRRAHLWSRPISRRGLFRRSAAALFTSTDGGQIFFNSGCAWGFCSASIYLSDSGCTRGPAVSRSRIAPYRSLKCRFALVLCRGGCGRRRPALRAFDPTESGEFEGNDIPLNHRATRAELPFSPPKRSKNTLT